MCLDNLKSSSPAADVLDEEEEGGAFAARFIAKGSVIAPMPLLALKRDDLVIYTVDEEAEHYRDTLDFDKIEGQEELLNYCFGHPDSDLLLLPYSPVVGKINFHKHRNKSTPNAEIRWPSNESSMRLLGRKAEEWLQLHPLDVLDQSGKLMLELVALRDIEPDEEVVIDYGSRWEAAWDEYQEQQMSSGDDVDDYIPPFRHEVGVPDNIYPDTWLNKSTKYEIAPIGDEYSPLEPGKLVQLTWAHNGKPVHKYGYVVGMPTGLTDKIRKFSDERGIIDHYKELLFDNILDADDYHLIKRQGETWFAQRYMNVDWEVSR